jgi:ABC-type branched-subunit amino acid transport system substrate-binding protein
MAILTVSSSVAGFPEQVAAMQAQVKTVNAAGGVNGHTVSLQVCNDQASPNQGATCAQQAVSNHVAAVIGGVQLGSTGVVPVLQHAGIPELSYPLLPAEFKSPISWPIVSGVPAQNIGLGEAMAKQGCKKVVAMAQDTPSATGSVPFLTAGVKAGGSEFVGTVTVPTTTTDLAPAVSQLVSKGADCVSIHGAGAEAQQFIEAIRQDAPQLKIGMTAAGLPQSTITALKGSANGIILADQPYPPNSDFPQVVAFRAAMSKYSPKEQADDLALVSWGQMNVLDQALKSISGTINASAVSKALGSLTKVDSGITPTFSFAKTAGLKNYPRLFNTNALSYTVKNGEYSYDKSSPYLNVAPVLRDSFGG